MSTRPYHAVIAVVRMSGVQDTQVDATHPNTDSAAVVVRIGKSLLYLHEQSTAEHFAEPWAEAAKLMRTLPLYSARDAVKPMEGMPDPAVLAHASGKPKCQINSVNDRGGQPFLRVQLGRIIYEVRDQHALTSCVQTFRDARRMARVVFRPTSQNGRTPDAVRAATNALAAERPRPGQNHERPVSRPTTVQNQEQHRREQGKAL